MSIHTTPPYPRLLERQLGRDLADYPVVAVMGARQVGKTTLARKVGRERGLAYVTLDDRDTRQRAIDDPEGLLESIASAGAVIDEIQRVPELLLAMKRVIDLEQGGRGLGRFLVTGSNQPRVQAGGVADSLQGRVAYRTLRPLTIGELRYDDGEPVWTSLFTHGLTDLITRLTETETLNRGLAWQDVVVAGGMPRALAAPAGERARILDDYTRTFASRDIRDILEVESSERFEAFFRLVGARTGTFLNESRLSRELGVAIRTVRRWLDALDRSYMTVRVRPYSRNAATRIVQAPKLFLVDSALAMAAARETVATGFHMETLVANALHTWQDLGAGRAVYHWRLASGPEADFVLEQAQAVVPVEVKAGDRADRRDGRHLEIFLDTHREAVCGLLLTSDPHVRAIADRVIAAPWWAVL
jgi:predicted AAA+ superfamily ATPase